MCSVVVPEKTPLSQEIIVDNYLAEIKINGEILKIYDSKLSSNPTKFDFILNSNDKLDIKIRNDEGPMGSLANLKYYDLNEKVKSFSTCMLVGVVKGIFLLNIIIINIIIVIYLL